LWRKFQNMCNPHSFFWGECDDHFAIQWESAGSLSECQLAAMRQRRNSRDEGANTCMLQTICKTLPTVRRSELHVAVTSGHAFGSLLASDNIRATAVEN
jgi:hypothetical protein